MAAGSPPFPGVLKDRAGELRRVPARRFPLRFQRAAGRDDLASCPSPAFEFDFACSWRDSPGRHSEGGTQRHSASAR